MRKLIVLLLVMALILIGLSILDVWVRHKVQSVVATHIEDELPGSTATVNISSFPFVGRLVASGSVPEMQVDVHGVSGGGVDFSDIEVVTHDLKLRTGKLTSGKVQLRSIGYGSVTGDVTEASVDHLTGVPATFGAGTIEVAGVTETPSLTVSDGAINVSAPQFPQQIRIPVPTLSILPCASSAAIVPGALQVSCELTSLPPALADYTVDF